MYHGLHTILDVFDRMRSSVMNMDWQLMHSYLYFLMTKYVVMTKHSMYIVHKAISILNPGQLFPKIACDQLL